jgi:hypothetical protein
MLDFSGGRFIAGHTVPPICVRWFPAEVPDKSHFQLQPPRAHAVAVHSLNRRLTHAVALRLEGGRRLAGIELRGNALHKNRAPVRGACPNGNVQIATKRQAGSRLTIAATRTVVSSTSTSTASLSTSASTSTMSTVGQR